MDITPENATPSTGIATGEDPQKTPQPSNTLHPNTAPEETSTPTSPTAPELATNPTNADIQEQINALQQELERTRDELQQKKLEDLKALRSAELKQSLDGLPEMYQRAYSHYQLEHLSSDQYTQMMTQLRQDAETYRQDQERRQLLIRPLALQPIPTAKEAEEELKALMKGVRV